MTGHLWASCLPSHGQDATLAGHACLNCCTAALRGSLRWRLQKSDVVSNNAWYLSPDYPNLERVPDKAASLSRTFGEFLVFWPADGKTLVKRTHADPSGNGSRTTRAAISDAGRLQPRVGARGAETASGAIGAWRIRRLCVPRTGGRRERLSVKVPRTAAPIGPAAVRSTPQFGTSVPAFNGSCSY